MTRTVSGEQDGKMLNGMVGISMLLTLQTLLAGSNTYSETSETDDTDLLARCGTVSLEGREDCETAAEHGSSVLEQELVFSRWFKHV